MTLDFRVKSSNPTPDGEITKEKKKLKKTPLRGPNMLEDIALLSSDIRNYSTKIFRCDLRI